MTFTFVMLFLTHVNALLFAFNLKWMFQEDAVLLTIATSINLTATIIAGGITVRSLDD